MTAKPRPRRRRKRSPGAVLRTYWIVVVAACALGAYGAWTLATLPAFRLQSLRITGLARVSRAQAVARAAIDPHANVWLLDRGAIRRRLEAIPYVGSVHVHVRPMGIVWLEVAERDPDACVRGSDGTTVTVDRALRELEVPCTGPSRTYVLRTPLEPQPGAYLAEPELRALEDDARILAGTSDRYRRFAHDAFGELDATLQDGVVVHFGDERDLERKQRLVGPILAQLGARAEAVRAVDVRAADTPVVEYRPVPHPSPMPERPKKTSLSTAFRRL